MRNLYLKQKVFTWGDKYNVFDSNQNIIYHIKGKVFSLRNKMDMFKNDQFIYHMERKLFHFMPHFTLFNKNQEEEATIIRRFTFIGGKLDIQSKYGQMAMIGQAFQRDFQLTKDGQVVMSIHKKWLSWGDTYEITIHDDEHEAFYVALAILIDVIFHQSSAQHSNTSSH